MWFVAIFAIAALFAASKAIPALLRGIAGIWKNWGSLKSTAVAKRRLAEDAADEGMAPRASAAGEKVGVATAAVVSGFRVAWTAFLVNWKRGWDEGQARGEARRDQVPYVPPSTDQAPGNTDSIPHSDTCIANYLRGGHILTCGKSTVGGSPYCQKHHDKWNTTNDPDGGVVHARCRTCGALNFPGLDQCLECIAAEADARRAGSCQSCGKSLEGEEVSERRPGWCCACTAKYPTPAPAADQQQTATTPSTEGTSMPIETATNGETRTLGATLSELDAIISNARAELEDATGDRKRADDEKAQVENMVTNLRDRKVDETTVNAVAALLEPFDQRATQASERAASADLRLNLAEAARATAVANHAGIRDAVHASAAKQAADGGFYDE